MFFIKIVFIAGKKIFLSSLLFRSSLIQPFNFINNYFFYKNDTHKPQKNKIPWEQPILRDKSVRFQVINSYVPNSIQMDTAIFAPSMLDILSALLR